MPRRKHPPRLWLRRGRRNPNGRGRGKAVWIILDSGKQIATGCLEGEDTRAQQALAEYIAEKHRPTRRERDIEQIHIADVLSIYVDDCGGRQANQHKFYERISRLNDYWGGKMLAEGNGDSCRAY